MYVCMYVCMCIHFRGKNFLEKIICMYILWSLPYAIIYHLRANISTQVHNCHVCFASVCAFQEIIYYIHMCYAFTPLQPLLRLVPDVSSCERRQSLNSHKTYQNSGICEGLCIISCLPVELWKKN